MIIIAAVITSWLTGLWSCEAGRKDLTAEERLTIADYINSISVLVQHSNKLSINFFTTLNKVKDTSRKEIDEELSSIIEESKVILQNVQEMNPPEFFEVPHGYLRLVFDMRSRAYENFKPAFFNVLDDLDPENSITQISNSFQYMLMSDEVYKYFQEELKKAGEELGVNNLTIIDSLILEDESLTYPDTVGKMVSDVRSVTDLEVRRGVAVITQSINFSPPIKNEQDDYFIIKNGNGISISINIENQGNVTENDVPVKMTYTAEGVSKPMELDEVINIINPSEQKTVTFSGLESYPGKRCEIIIEAGPVENEVLFTNNTAIYKFLMEQ